MSELGLGPLLIGLCILKVQARRWQRGVVTAECRSNVSVTHYVPDRIRLSRSCSFPQYNRFPFGHLPAHAISVRTPLGRPPRSPLAFASIRWDGTNSPAKCACMFPPTSPPPTVPPPRLLRFYRHLLETTACQVHCTGSSPHRPRRTLLLGPDSTALAQHVMDRADNVPRASRWWGRRRRGTGKWWADVEREGEPVPDAHPPCRLVGPPKSPAPIVRGGLRYNVTPAQEILTPRTSEGYKPDAATLQYALAKKRAMQMRAALANGATSLSASGGIAVPSPSVYLDTTTSMPANGGLAPPMNTQSGNAE